MRLYVHLAMGLGLALLQTTSAPALQQRPRDHSVRHESARHHTTRHASAADRSTGRASHHRVHKNDDGERDAAQLLVGLKHEVRDLRKQIDELEGLRQELTELKQKIWAPAPFSLALVTKPDPAAPADDRSAGLTDVGGGALTLPDATGPKPGAPPRPDDPLQASLPVILDNRAAEKLQAKSAVEEAKAYLLATAHPGDSMTRQGSALAIERLHPALIVKLAVAIKRARDAGLNEAGIFSAYRPPEFHIGGFKDKFKSLHSYGLAADMSGIGHAGSDSARLWKTIAEDTGLYVPYGAANRAEFNHTQLIPAKMAPDGLHATIVAAGPKDLRRMWIASGIGDYVADVPLAQLAAAMPPAAIGASADAPAADKRAADAHSTARSLHKTGKHKTAEAREKPAHRASSKIANSKETSREPGKPRTERHAQRDVQRSAGREHRGETIHQRMRAASHEGKPHGRRKKSEA